MTALEPVKIAWGSLRLAGTAREMRPSAVLFLVPGGTKNTAALYHHALGSLSASFIAHRTAGTSTGRN